MPTILCFGDSNTHGTPPMPTRDASGRFGPAERWPGVMAGLHPDWTVIEEGLPGRTAQFDDPVMGPHMDGRLGLKIALNSHGPLDALVIMLGTNDGKARFGADAPRVAAGMAALVDLALDDLMQAKHGGFRVLIVAPPPVVEVGCLMGEFFGAAAVTGGLAPLYRRLAEARGCGFLDAGSVIAVSPVDGVHYDAAAHAALGRAIGESVQALLAPSAR